MIILLVIVLLAGIVTNIAKSDEAYSPMYVQTRLLNGRSAPRKTASIEARFDYGDELIPTGEWSEDHKWIEVYGGESGTVWIYITYISERTHYKVTNENNGKVKVRKWPETGKVIGYIRHGKTIEIEQKIFNWGKTKSGWVDLDYFVEEVN